MLHDINEDPTGMRNLNRVFDCLDAWRHCSGYQLERRADVFFSLYLAEVLSVEFGIHINSELIPEFPLPIEPKEKQKPNRRTNRVDFAALSGDGETLFLVEIKTDMRSRRKVQEDYLNKATEKGAETLLRELINGLGSASQVRKHYCLLQRVASLGLIHITEPIQEHMRNAQLRGLTKLRNGIQPQTLPKQIKVVFVQPVQGIEAPGILIVSFEKFAQTVDKHSDALSRRFSKSLRNWARDASGQPGELPTTADC